jgi:AcrR family transcriptional regulator
VDDIAQPPVADGSPEWAGRRADARRNHEKVLAAATEVFTEHGMDATIPQVAERAGVGKATVYRSYPTKADLVRALAQVHVDWLRDRINRASEEAATDAYRALGGLLEDAMHRLAADKLMVEVMAAVEEDDLPVAADLDRVLELGREQGTLRDDVTGMDVAILAAGCARALLGLEIRDPAVWRRYAELCLAAFRP